MVLVGRGRVGRGLARALRAGGATVHLLRGQTTRLPDANVVVLCVPDGQVPEVSRRLDALAPARVPFLHCAGALGPEALACAHRPRGALHPMVSFADPRRPPLVAGTTFTIAGDVAARRAARRLARIAGARVLDAPLHGAGYHAAAALVANGAAGLATVGAELLEALGAERRDAERTLAGLLRTVADNVERLGVPAALTGPIRRGDVDTVIAHRRALRRYGQALAAYDAMAPIILRTAQAAGLPPGKARALRRLLEDA